MQETQTTFSTELTKEIKRKLTLYAKSLTGSDFDSDDLLQDTLLRGYQNFEKFEPNSNFGGWMSTIMKNVFINQYRTKASTPQMIEVQEWICGVTHNDSEVALAVADITRIIEKVNDPNRELFEMKVKGYKYEEIVVLKNTTMGTVKSRIHTVKANYQRALSANGYGY